MDKKLPSISSQIKKWLLVTLLAVFITTSGISVQVQYHSANREAESFMRRSVSGLIDDIERELDDFMIMLTRYHAANYEGGSKEQLEALMKAYNSDEIDIIDEKGIVLYSTEPINVGFDFYSNEISAQFFYELKEVGVTVVQTRESVNDSSIRRMYSAVSLDDNSYIQVGYDEDCVNLTLEGMVIDFAANKYILENGMVFILDRDNEILSHRADLTGDNLRKLLTSADIHGDTGVMKRTVVEGDEYYWMYDTFGAFYLVCVLTREEVMKSIITSLVLTVILGVVLFVSFFFVISLLINRKIVSKVTSIAGTLSEITNGDLDAKVSVHSSREFDLISKGINTTVDVLKGHIAAEAARIDSELKYAQEIQHSVLPALTDNFTRNKNFSVFASMTTAKEVGGDFYDFGMLDEDTLFFMIADVSGKGIPGAMFMMNGKATLHDCVTRHGNLGTNISYANKRICEGNEADMFITAWAGILDTKTGKLRFVNAGHNPPVMLRSGKAQYLETDIDLILGLMDDEEYSAQTLQLRKGDILFLYTDGVTEAVNKEQKLYGEERLLDALNGIIPETDNICAGICRSVLDDVEKYADGAPQADDITMLCLYYK